MRGSRSFSRPAPVARLVTCCEESAVGAGAARAAIALAWRAFGSFPAVSVVALTAFTAALFVAVVTAAPCKAPMISEASAWWEC